MLPLTCMSELFWSESGLRRTELRHLWTDCSILCAIHDYSGPQRIGFCVPCEFYQDGLFLVLTTLFLVFRGPVPFLLHPRTAKNTQVRCVHHRLDVRTCVVAGNLLRGFAGRCEHCRHSRVLPPRLHGTAIPTVVDLCGSCLYHR